MIDLRSDTVTQPTARMRRAIAEAEVGDDLFRDDPTVLALEARVAELLGKEDAVFVASGTMANQVALRAQTRPGDAVLVARNAHIATSELGAPAALSGLTVTQLPGERGRFTPDAVRAAIPNPDGFMPETVIEPVRLLAAENTHNEAGGTVWPTDQLRAVAEAARDEGLATHLDGARLWNATAASGVAERDFAAPFDTVSVCFSKGLGAPVGSAVAGSRDVVEEARRAKQLFGGGWRQAGMMAAGALHAVDHHRERLVDDHATAARLAAGLAETPGVDLDGERVQTNIVYFDLHEITPVRFCEELAKRGVLMLPMGPATVRAVTHMEISVAQVDKALDAITEILSER